jgi:biotin carboxyl carrier protein
MILQAMQAVVEESEKGYRILSPVVGDFNVLVSQGTPLRGGQVIGKIRILNRLHDVVLPGGIGGTAVVDPEADFARGVGYRDELLRLDRTAAGIEDEKPENGPVKKSEEIGEGFVVRAFTTGIFYRRPSPDAPPFVDVDSVVERGKILGLIEVMKSFNQITFTGDDNITSGSVARIYAEDSQEVKSGDPLFLITHDGGS